MSPQTQTPFSALRRFAQPPQADAPAPEHCELCSAEIAAEHDHLIEPVSRELLCACQPCAILFSGEAEMKYRRVPRDVRSLPDFQLDDIQWNALAIPTGMAFFFHSTAAGKMTAIYPSPGGPTESLLELEAWNEIAQGNAALKRMQPDTEALLVNRIGEARDYYLTPIDRCYGLVGLVRAHWKGLSGGTEVWDRIERFFASLNDEAQPAKGTTHA